MKTILILSLLLSKLFAINIIQKPIIFDNKRVSLTKKYIKEHYSLDLSTIKIMPKIIVVHHTGINDFDKSFMRFYSSVLPKDRGDIKKAGKLNVSTHFLVDRDGSIYQLMDETTMARHVIGLNYSSIGIENVGGEKFEDNLTKKQLEANSKLIKYLQKKYKSIKYLIAHSEYKTYESHSLWLEKDVSYRTIKHDPSLRFMKELREKLKENKK